MAKPGYDDYGQRITSSGYTPYANTVGTMEPVKATSMPAIPTVQLPSTGTNMTNISTVGLTDLNKAQAEYYKKLSDQIGETTIGDYIQGVGAVGNLGLGIASFFDQKNFRKKQMEGIDTNIRLAKEANQRRKDFISGTKSAFA